MSQITIDFNPGATAARLAGQSKRAQLWLDNEVLKDSAPYVPRLTGELERSGIDGTKIGTGQVVYNKPYASRQYYGSFTHSTQAHPQASRLWFETSKAQNRRKWLVGVRKLAGGGL